MLDDTSKTLTRAAIQVLIDGQSWLYSQLMAWKSELYGQKLTEQQLEDLQDEWKQNTADLIKEVLTDGSEGNEGQQSFDIDSTG